MKKDQCVMNHIETMCRDHFNEPIIAMEKVGRLVGYAEDDRDCYLVISYPRHNRRDTERELIYHTAVGGYMFLERLKGQDAIRSNAGEEWDDFTRLDSALACNGAPKAERFILEFFQQSATSGLLNPPHHEGHAQQHD